MSAKERIAKAHASAKVNTGPLPPLLPLPKPSPQQHVTEIPSRAETALPAELRELGWRCETFTFPAAFPRSVKGSAIHRVQPTPPAKVDAAAGRLTPEEVQSKVAAIYERQAGAVPVDHANAKELADQEPLSLVVNRYYSTQQVDAAKASGLTLVLSHANGFHKETWEPTIIELLKILDPTVKSNGPRPNCLPVDEFWALDVVNQGDAALLNEGLLGDTFQWADNGRDILQFMVNYLPPADTSDPPGPFESFGVPAKFTPTEDPSLSHFAGPDSHGPPARPLLPQDLNDAFLTLLDGHSASPQHKPAPSPLSSTPVERTWRKRRIVGIGHSLGGGGLGVAASCLPAIYSSLVFVDPVLPSPQTDRRADTDALVGGAIVRRNTWASRKEAKEGFLKKGFFKRWDKRALDAYVEHGMYETKGGVALKTRPDQEALVFADPGGALAKRAWLRLAGIPATLPTHFIFAQRGQSVIEFSADSTVSQIKGATSTRIEGAGHLIVQEKPKELAQELVRFFERVYPLKKGAKL